MKFNFFISILLLCFCSCVNPNEFDPNTIPVNVLDVENHQMLELLKITWSFIRCKILEEISKVFEKRWFINFYDENLEKLAD